MKKDPIVKKHRRKLSTGESSFFIDNSHSKQCRSGTDENSDGDRLLSIEEKCQLLNSRNLQGACSGTPSSFNHNTVDYLVSLAKHLISEAGSDTIETLIQRFKEECSGVDPLNLLCSEQCCQALEIVCERSTDFSIDLLQKLLRLKRKNIRKVFDNNFGARCVECMLYKIGQSPNGDQQTKADQSEIDLPSDLIKNWCEIAVENIGHLCTEYGGSHLLRCLIRVLCGLGNGSISSGVSRTDKKRNNKISSSFKLCLDSIFNFLLDWEYVSGYLHCEPVSLLVQDMVELNATLVKTAHLNKFIESCLAVDKKQIKSQICDKQASRVYEKLIIFCNEDQLEQMLNNHLKSSLAFFCVHRFANFVVQRLLERCSTEEMLTDIFDEILPLFDELWTQGKLGVLVAMAKACVKTKYKQTELKSHIRQHLGCTSEVNYIHILPLILQDQQLEKVELDPFGSVPIEPHAIKLQGSLLIQVLMNFKATEDICTSLLGTRTETLVQLMKHPIASHLIDSFLQSETVKGGNKVQFYEKTKNELHKIACDKVGTRVLEMLWNSSVMNDRIRDELAGILVRKQSSLTKHPMGQIICSKLELNLFKNNKKRWKDKFRNS